MSISRINRLEKAFQGRKTIETKTQALSERINKARERCKLGERTPLTAEESKQLSVMGLAEKLHFFRGRNKV